MSNADSLPPLQMPYGAWKSPLSAEALADSQVRFENLCSVAGGLYWTENVPSAGGTHGVFRLGARGAAIPVVPSVSNVRGRVHEYGAAPYLIVGDTAYYTKFADQRLYRLAPGTDPKPLQPRGIRTPDGCR